ncbi:DUF257 family protein [Thermococcus aciditolerans]|uniref:KaiC-like domain-containing protein n=1 Tax=Thermococcus aciditolerans TaxID=2598455 RepID=A0A5C0SJN0_9EURY|nr:DUF257 family protein [Thermococcus aciditolerans]QEK14212.1 hypothetical protein FPV09_02795 [Thermococcus aciditolerans]
METAGEDVLFEYIKDIKPGEDILIEYTSKEPVHILLHLILRCLRKNGLPVIIVDELDQLHVFRTHMKLAGIDTELIDTANVIKIGGLLKTGNVLGKVDLSKELPIRKKHYEEALKKINADYTVRIVLGFDKVLAMHEEERRDLESLFGRMIRPYLGDEGRATIYFINTELFSERTLKEFREHASRVFKVRLDGDRIELKIIMSLSLSEYGKKIEIRVRNT